MKIAKATLENKGMSLTLWLGDPQATKEADQLVRTFKEGDYEIKAKKKKRSLDANAMAWVLCQKIGDAVGISKEEVYKNAIADGNAFEVLSFDNQGAADAFIRVWGANGLGWQCEKLDTLRYAAYYGSSVYNTREMSVFIDYLIQDAKALGIETLSEREQSLLLEDWDAKQKD